MHEEKTKNLNLNYLFSTLWKYLHFIYISLHILNEMLLWLSSGFSRVPGPGFSRAPDPACSVFVGSHYGPDFPVFLGSY